jgi:uncharacterized cupin superfamily protein
MANVLEPDFDAGSERAGFTHRAAKIARQAGAQRIGATLYELPPGEAMSPYHAHLANEELAIVLSGRPSLRTQGGWRQLETGEAVGFPAGAEFAHQIANFGSEPARVLMVSEMNEPEVAIYPDSGKVMAREQAPGLRPTGYRKLFRDADEVDYWDGESPPDAEAR